MEEITWKGNQKEKAVAESRKTEVYQSDGELEDGMPADEDPGETNAEAEN